MKLLIYPALDKKVVEKITSVSDQVEILNINSEEEALQEIESIDAVYGTINPALLERAKKLNWIQAPSIGLEKYMFPALIESDIEITNMAGIFSDVIADHTLTYILMFARGFHLYVRKQLARNWEPGVPVIHLADQTLGIIGLGGIGMEIASRAAACGMRVIATDAKQREKPDFVNALWENDKLNDLLEESDFVVSCVPHSPETVKLIGEEQLQRMKKSAYFINISRGMVVDLAALTHALETKTIAGAGLDVFETEPLPSDHPLWEMENVIITPHIAGASAYIQQRRVATLIENLRRYISGKPLQNVVDRKKWF
jgi:phosphoglycerate dehydrogenase-like enzyme